MIKRINILPFLQLLLVGIACVLLPATLHAQTIRGSVYGGGEVATIGGSTSIAINSGRFGADIFGGGKGNVDNTDPENPVVTSADITGNTTVEIFGGEFSVVKNEGADKDVKPFMERYNIYGGGNVACVVAGNTYLKMAKGMFSNVSDGTGTFLETGKGMDEVYMHEGKMFFCAFGGGFGKNTIVRGNTYVDFNVVFAGCKDITKTGLTDNMIENQTLLDVVGGGFNGTVGGNTYVHVGGDAMCRNLYGGGLYATIGGGTFVDVTGGNIDNVYGGGVMGDILGTVDGNSTLVNIGLHADKSHEDAAGNTITYKKDNGKITILGSVYGGNDVSGHVGTATINHLGGTIDQNIYGAGNGDYNAYYEPGLCAFKEGENDNYITVNNGDGAPNGMVYKARPHTENANIIMGGATAEDKAVVKGQVFVGGNSCTIGNWDGSRVITDPLAFQGGGSAHITINSHTSIGYSNADLANASEEERELYQRDGENVSGLFMGCSGDHLATQNTDAEDKYYHRYYDKTTNKYWPGFPVYSTEGDGSALLTRSQGQAVYNAYLNNILIWSDDVSLTIPNDATDIWLANFVGGGFRGSMKAKTAAGHFDYTLPAGVTVANNVIGGSYNAHVMYRIFKTTNGHTYTTNSDGNYEYLTSTEGLDGPETAEPDYLDKVYDDDGNVISLVRFYYDGGILAENDNEGNEVTTRRKLIAGTGDFSAEAAETLKNNINTASANALLRLNLLNKMEPSLSADGIVSAGNVFGGCFQSGTVNGDSWVNYACTVTDDLSSAEGFSMANQEMVNAMLAKADDYNKNFGLMLFGAGYGRDTEMKGDCFTAVGTGAKLYNAFGGSYKGKCDSRTFMFCDSQSSGIVAGRLYGGSSMGDIGGSAYAYVNSGNISYVYGGNDVCGKIDGHTYVLVHGGTVFGDVYGAGNGNYLYQVDPQVKEIVATWNNDLNKYIYRVPVPADMVSSVPLTAEQKLTIINNTRPSVTQANIELNGKAGVAASGTEGQPGYVPAKPAEYLYINGSAYVGGNSSTVTDDSDPVRLKIGKYVVLNNLFLGSNGENLKVFEYVSNLEKLNDMKLNTNELLDKYMNGAVAVGNLSPEWATAFSQKENYEETYIGNLCLGGNAGSMLADKKLALTIPETVTMFGNFIAGSKDAVFKYRDAEHRGGMTQPMAEGHYDEPKLELHIRNKWQAKKLSFLPANAANHYLVDNLDGEAYAEGCNVYGGCYQSGTMIGSIKMYIESDMLEYNNDLSTFEASESATKLKNSNARNITVANIYGAGYGPESRNYGNVDIILKDIPGSSAHPSINNIYGGGRNGVLCGHANVRINDGLVYGDVVGGCFAANLYGSTNITVGYPKYYICKQSGKYTLQRGDTWNVTLEDKDGNKVLKDEIRYLKGDRVPQNIYEQIVGFCAIGSEDGDVTSLSLTKGTTSDYFTYVDEATLTGEQSLFPSGGWSAVDINIRGGVYGGGYSLNNSTAATAGSNTVRKMTAHTYEGDGFNHDRDQTLGLTTGQTTVGYGGNSSIIVADNVTLGANHIKISQSGVGGIFGDGHLVFCEGFRAADITGYGYGGSTVSTPLLLNTFQRFDLLDVNDCCLLLDGAQDFAADQTDATVYSLSRVNELRMNSSIDASANLTAKRNYMGFNKNVHLLGSLITNDAFDSALRHDETGVVQTDTYKENKSTIITNNYPADTDAKLAAFKQRNLGTARNMIGLNSGYALRIQNQHYTESAGNKVAQKYYGPVIGVCEVKLLTLTEGEGGGYVYAKNIHSDANNFLNTSGNFVFPSITNDGKTQYVVDDCFPKSFSGTASAEAHYWYVEGDKYFFNTTLTGYTFKKETAADKQTFHLIDNDSNVLLSGVDNTKKLRVASVTWKSSPTGYQSDLKDTYVYPGDYKPTPISGETSYTFSINVGSNSTDSSNDIWNSVMDRKTNITAKEASTYPNGSMPIFDVVLQDYVNNDGEAYYNEHLSLPENVTIVMEALDSSDNLVGTYTINMDIVYVLGPTYNGNVLIKNCALPGERIAFGSDGITVKTSDQMPITGTGWKLCPVTTKGSAWTNDNAQGAIDIPSTQYDSDLSGGATTGWVHAQRKYDGWNVAYTFTAGGHEFTVWPSQSATNEYEKYLVVHNYYHMSDVLEDGELYHIHPDAGARIYINNEKDLRAFFTYLDTKANGTEQTATDGHKYTIPANMERMHVFLQNDIKLTQALPTLSHAFAGTLHGDGCSINLNDKQSTLFGDKLTGKVYNLGVVGGTITTVDNATENCYDSRTNADDIKYGKLAYTLSDRYKTTDEEYIKGIRYEGSDWQYARSATEDSRMLRTSMSPNYGSTVTAHNMSHTAAEITEHDCLFFGQTLSPSGVNTTPYPQHISADEANRVYEAQGYYRSATDQKFYYNTEAWALQPSLTAVGFIGNDVIVPTSFGNSAADDEEATPGMQHVTKNLLVYVPATAEIAKATDSEDYFLVTKDAEGEGYTCADLALVDKEDFNAPIQFTATKASYTRNPAEETGYVEAPGTAWESICLPFSPSKATLSEGIERHKDAQGNGAVGLQKDITFFFGADDGADIINHEYWLRELKSVGGTDGHITADFVRPSENTFVAYTPYIVSFPGSKFYEFDMTGQTVTFSAEGATIAVTDDATKQTTVNGYTYTGAFLKMKASEDKYVMNNDGSSFVKNIAVVPFRGWMSAAPSPAKSRAIYIGGILENAPEEWSEEQSEPLYPEAAPQMKAYVINRNIIIDSTYEADVLIYNAAGQLARAVHVLEGQNLYTGFANGVYIVNGKKMVVR